MYLSLLKVSGFRNLDGLRFQPGPRFNCISGDNGSGKSSLLEALYVLGTGKSYRVAQHRPLIHIQAERFSLYGELQPSGYAIGMERSRQSDSHIVVNGDRVHSASQLAAIMPVQALTLDDFQLFEGGPRVRRRFLDWGVFHVEQQGSGPVFRRFERAVKQRNSGLKSGKISASERQAWTHEFLRVSGQLHELRTAYTETLLKEFRQLCERSDTLAFGRELGIQYSPGWDSRLTLEEALSRPGIQERERRTGITQVGPHRADLRMLWEGMPARDVLSRGQMKVLGHCLKLAQIRCLAQRENTTLPIILMDDLAAELDQAHLTEMLRLIDSFDTQVFMTVLAADQLPAPGLWSAHDDPRWFAVEAGRVHPYRLQE
ncbi:DNA replication/repair protein RecF [Natronospirillum operosum]|uniref:DNA replication and repair protein RecF n=1 Tax=Natronospirillum operosum TaxID=2759953 RepID=A0A4Z0WCG8_9GAMM|nr:DNA replication/repair protein RecF [Natronospirillum operosum]TGG91503.1 DNA replication/repair protein RecF [Natronospirillum operosum]